MLAADSLLRQQHDILYNPTFHTPTHTKTLCTPAAIGADLDFREILKNGDIFGSFITKKLFNQLLP